MEDLDLFLSDSQARPFYIKLGAAYASGSLSITDHRYIAEWLGSYCYIIPLKRRIHKPLRNKLLEILEDRNLFEIACRVEHISVTYSVFEQQDILKELEGGKMPG